MKTLAEFKRHLATEGATLQMTAYEILKGDDWVSMPVRNPEPRTVAIVQTNAVALHDSLTKSRVSWLYFDKAKDWEFTDTTAIQTSKGIRLTYTIA